ncbi:MAG: glycosyltransferase family 2 protein [Desulfobacter sp.]|nr:MAG: glycosyltransferase family 2 protein [Desulfobacter sp.]
MVFKNEVSVVVPVYGCRECLGELVKRLEKALIQIADNYEIILVNDDSPDGAWTAIKDLTQKDSRIKGINFSRNFGQHYAITAGLDFAEGQWVVVMDCDLQDQPEEIPKLYHKVKEGYEVVFGRRAERKDGFFKKLGSKLYYKTLDYFTEQQSDNTIANFGIYHAKVIESFRLLREQNRLFPISVKWLGFKTAYLDIDHAERFAGKTSYSFFKLRNLAIDNIIAQSNKPLKISIKLGFSLSFLSILYALYLVVRYFIYTVPVAGWTSTIVSIYFLSGLILANMGILGLYLGKVFNETKKRPLYVISEKVGFE